jgi:hypothetical protein
MLTTIKVPQGRALQPDEIWRSTTGLRPEEDAPRSFAPELVREVNNGLLATAQGAFEPGGLRAGPISLVVQNSSWQDMRRFEPSEAEAAERLAEQIDCLQHLFVETGNYDMLVECRSDHGRFELSSESRIWTVTIQAREPGVSFEDSFIGRRLAYIDENWAQGRLMGDHSTALVRVYRPRRVAGPEGSRIECSVEERSEAETRAAFVRRKKSAALLGLERALPIQQPSKGWSLLRCFDFGR